MKEDDWRRVAKWTAFVYTPIILLIIGVFLLVQWQAKKVDEAKPPLVAEEKAP